MSLQGNRLGNAADQNINSYVDQSMVLSRSRTQTMSYGDVVPADLWVIMSGSDNVSYDKESESDSESESALRRRRRGGR